MNLAEPGPTVPLRVPIGLKNRPVFLKITENRWNRTDLNLKTAEFTVHCFKISEKDKNQQNICKN
jgi:hypothetical protein